MIRSLPNALMIGATGRNVGKTEYAARLAARLAASGPVAAAKVTLIHEVEAACPRGGDGCGVCGALRDRPFVLTEEEKLDGVKDTSRLRVAGARPVWWLRVDRAHLEEGLAELVGRLDPGVPVIIESNSARHYLEPGLFLIITDGSPAIKDSCRQVLGLADATPRRIGTDWDIGVDRPLFSSGRWTLRGGGAAIRESGFAALAGRA